MRLFFPLLLLGWCFLLPAVEVKVPALRSPVMDEANFLPPQEREELARFMYEIHAHQGPQVTLLTVPDLQGFTIEEFSIRVAEKWQLGSKEKDNGLIVIVSRQERKIRIEVGSGLEGDITDYESAHYIREILIPSLKQGKLHQGMRLMLEDIAVKLNLPIKPSGSRILRRSSHNPQAPAWLTRFFPFIFIFAIIFMISMRRSPHYIRGLVTAAMGGLMAFLAGGGIALIIGMALFAFLIGFSGFHHTLPRSGHRYDSWGGGSGWGGGSSGSSWGGGGGGFSGGGASGDW